MKSHSKTCHKKFSSSSHNCKISGKIVVYNKNHHNKLILIIFALQCIYSNLQKKVIHPTASREVIN
jgi:hypothetical protein